MRLICPNCDAQYEVPDEVMPADGRDVQCSNCGQTWFQHHPDNAPDEDEDGVDVDAPAADEEISPPPQETQKPPQRRTLDPNVADILRQEAEAEQDARRARQQDALESQPDLGLDTGQDDIDADDHDAGRRAREARERMARMRGEPPPISEAAATAAAISSRRDLLPDIEEINSTLRSTNDRNAASNSDLERDAPVEKQRKRGFRRGFTLVLALFLILAAIYIYAPAIARAVPQADPYLSAFVAWVDQMRVVLDSYVERLLRWLDNMASQSGN